ncbi:DUF3850 domain-containing protein [Acetobacter pasteurianus]|uniref:DUF3850 domain-containing protein n=1 Tax=Acetobacter pasteurianus TaxID=438 RepID=UPI0018D3FF3D|nr:DUF3850 domain-containing protein [Acetobacter pasteurianus]
MRHELKIERDHFDKIMSGEKTCEIRLNDRDYKVGDILHLRAIRKDGSYWGIVCDRGISHVLKDFEGLAEGYVALSLR